MTRTIRPTTTIRTEAGRTIVSLAGEHDLSSVVELSETMARAIALDETDVVVDLSDVDFMGAATVGAIVRADASLRRRSRALTVRSPSTRARRVLDVCGLAALIDAELADPRTTPSAIPARTNAALVTASDPER